MTYHRRKSKPESFTEPLESTSMTSRRAPARGTSRNSARPQRLNHQSKKTSRDTQCPLVEERVEERE